jgi:hypothetical protein
MNNAWKIFPGQRQSRLDLSSFQHRADRSTQYTHCYSYCLSYSVVPLVRTIRGEGRNPFYSVSAL